MSYAVFLSGRAIDDLRRLPVQLREFIVGQIERLAQDPVGLSRRSFFPYPQGQAYTCNAEYEGKSYYFTVFFKYRDTQDENQIGIGFIASIPRAGK